MKDEEIEGAFIEPLLGGRQALTLVGCSPTLRTAGLAVCLMILLPVPGGWLWVDSMDVEGFGEPNGLKSEVAVAWVRGRIGIGRGPSGGPHRSADALDLFPPTPVI